MIGILLTTYNDCKAAIESYNSLLNTISDINNYEFVVVDGGSNKSELENIKSFFPNVIGPYQHLSEALNSGISYLLNKNVSHVIWIHTDMRYYDYDWIKKLVWVYDYLYPLFGRLGPGTSNIDNSNPNNIVLHGSNQCPWCMSSDVLLKCINKFGWVYDPKYINIGGCEDWDHSRRLLSIGYGFGVCSLVDVWHKGMGTRELRDTNSDQIYNRNVYFNNWKTWNQPGFELDFTEIGQELRFSFEKQFNKVWYK